MKRRLDFKNRWVVVTGASSGLGREMALVLAEQEQANLIITARRIEKLEGLKLEIESSGKSRVVVIQADLSVARDIDTLFSKSIAVGEIYALVNNAGFTDYGKTDAGKIPLYEKIIQVNLIATMKLTLKFLAYFREKRQGAVLNISSQGAFLPIPYQSIYSASKSSIQGFSEALREENRGSGVIISTFAPGGIDTDMVSSSGISRTIPDSEIYMMNPRKAAIKAVRAFKCGKALAIPGLVNRLIYMFARHFPRRWVVRVAGGIYRPK